MMTLKKNHSILLVITGVAIALRAYGIQWGLPEAYEEATPFRKAWEMWGWGEAEHLDFNPHFFNYPSLTIYLQFLFQGILYSVMRLFGTIQSSVDFQLAYFLDKTPFFIVGRSVSAAIGAATIGITFVACRRFTGTMAAVVAAGLLAINTFHITRSQMIEVDIPLAFLVMLTLLLLVDLTDNPKAKNYVMSGLMIGLATSAKYTGALLLLPLLVAHVLTLPGAHRFLRTKGKRKTIGSWSSVALAGAIAAIAFLVTSPYVALDATTFLRDFGLEREHMKIGHFGIDATSSWLFYFQSATEKLLGWPGTLLALGGIIYFIGVRREKWALITGAFVLPYTIGIGSWAMQADRYLLPILAPMFVYASAALIASTKVLPRIPQKTRPILAVAFALLVAYPLLAQFPAHWNRLKTDTRSTARAWIENNVPAGSFIVSETYGPELFDALDFWNFEPVLRQRIREIENTPPLYAMLTIPLLVLKPETTAPFYDIDLYEVADVIITSSAVKSRYLAEPERYRSQIAFYNSLDTRFESAIHIEPDGGPGPTITIYKNARQAVHFSGRKTLAEPVKLQPAEPSGSEDSFYFDMGLNHATFRFFNEALVCYRYGTSYPVDPKTYYHLSLAIFSAFRGIGDHDRALEALEQTVELAPTPGVRKRLIAFRRGLGNAP